MSGKLLLHFRALSALVRIRLLKQRVPLFLEWNLTFRCNLKCQYCGACDARGEELDAAGIKAGLDALWRAGVRWVTFGGGEPLLRSDLLEILQHAKHRGYQVFLSSNGILLPKKPEVLPFVDHFNFSLDGPREIHDAVRGKGSFDKTLDAIAFCRQAKADVSLQCVLSSLNLDGIDSVLDIAREQGVNVMFQPATKWLDSSTKPNPIAPPVDAYRAAIERLIQKKRAGAPVRNSIAGLRHLAKWPDPTPIWCSAAVLTCTAEPDGTLLACHQAEVGHFLKNDAKQGSLGEQCLKLKQPRGCRQCWCAPMVELELLFSLRPEPVLNALRMIL